jgi:predicted permease
MLTSLAERYSPRAGDIHLDGAVLGFAIILSLVVAVLLSYAPALAKEGSLAAWITAGTTRASGNVRRQRLQRGLVVAQIAVSVMLLTGAGLLTRTMLALSEVDTGLRAEEVLTMEIPLNFGQRTDAETRALYDRMRLELGAVPGVKDVGIGNTMPLRAQQFALDMKIENRQLATGEPMPHSEFRTANPDFFRAAGIPVLKGRDFATTDAENTLPVAVINKTLADKYFPGQDPIGKRLTWTGEVLKFIGMKEDWVTIVGVIGDTKDGGLDAVPRNVVYRPFTQMPAFAGAGLVIRAQANAASLAPAATRVVRTIAPKEPIENVLTVGQIRDESVAPRRLNAILVSSFGVLAVIIAAVGIAGVLAFSVSARTNEIGIRMSLGADSGRVQRMILGEGGILLAIGLLVGVIGSLSGTQFIRGLLFGIAPHDPATLAIVAVAMGVVGIAACWLPAARAASIDPAVAIRRQ